jgi:hypothetical protein
MKRIALLGVIFVLAAPTAVALAGSSGRRTGHATASLPRAELAGFTCQKAVVQANRSVSVRAVMRPVTGTEKMQMRFELLSSSAPGAAFVEQPGSGLDTWISPADPTLGQDPGDVWIVPDVVKNLPAPAIYRYTVSFRWTGTGGKVLATQTRTTRGCHQHLFLPDLLVASIAIEPAAKATRAKYVATIENDGQAPVTTPFSVTFTPGAPGLQAPAGTIPTTTTKTIERLDIGPTHEVNLTFFGPACTASTAPTVVVDPDHTVDQSDLTDNSLTVDPTCPALTSAVTPAS